MVQQIQTVDIIIGEEVVYNTTAKVGAVASFAERHSILFLLFCCFVRSVYMTNLSRSRFLHIDPFSSS